MSDLTASCGSLPAFSCILVLRRSIADVYFGNGVVQIGPLSAGISTRRGLGGCIETKVWVSACRSDCTLPSVYIYYAEGSWSSSGRCMRTLRCFLRILVVLVCSSFTLPFSSRCLRREQKNQVASWFASWSCPGAPLMELVDVMLARCFCLDFSACLGVYLRASVCVS